MKKNIYRFVLIHGAWHTGSAWSEVAKELRRMGHEVYTPTVAGHGKSADKSVSHADQVASVVEYITNNDLSDFILLGHSSGGTIVSKVAEAVSDRIRRLVYQSGFVLQDEHNVLDECPPAMQGLVNQLHAASKDGSTMLPFPVWRELFMNDASLELAERTYSKLSSEPAGAHFDKLDLKKFYELIAKHAFGTSYIFGTADLALRGEYAWVPRFPDRLGLCRMVEMKGGHETLFTNPKGLAEKIFEAGRD